MACLTVECLIYLGTRRRSAPLGGDPDQPRIVIVKAGFRHSNGPDRIGHGLTDRFHFFGGPPQLVPGCVGGPLAWNSAPRVGEDLMGARQCGKRDRGAEYGRRPKQPDKPAPLRLGRKGIDRPGVGHGNAPLNLPQQPLPPIGGASEPTGELRSQRVPVVEGRGLSFHRLPRKRNG